MRCNAAGVLQSSINFPSVYVRTIQDGDVSNQKNEIQQIRFIDGAQAASSGSFRLWVDRDGNSSLIPTAAIDYAAANDIAQNAIYNALTMDNGAGETIATLGLDNVLVTKVATAIWNIEFQMGQGDGISSNDLYTDMDPIQIDTTAMSFNASRIHATPVTILPGQSTSLRLNLSVFTP